MGIVSPEPFTQGDITHSAYWYSVDPDSIGGRDLGELDVWKRTGATIAAVRRFDQTMTYPGPDFLLCEEDHVYVVGTGKQLNEFENLFQLKRVCVPSYE